MKLVAKLSPRWLRSRITGRRRVVYFLATLFALLSAVPPRALCAAPANKNSLAAELAAVKALAKQKLTAPEYADAVAKLAAADPNDAAAIVTEAVKDEPAYACDVLRETIKILTPANSKPDPKLVATIVADVVQNIQATNPEIINQFIDCALDVAQNAGPAILNALAGISFTGLNSLLNSPGAVVGVGPTPVGQVTSVQSM